MEVQEKSSRGMKILIQWATSPRSDGIFIDSAEWSSLPKKPAPRGGESLDGLPGWVNLVVCQGLEFASYDHIAIEDTSEGACKITGWCDDPMDFPDDKYAAEWLMYTLRRDQEIGGQWNTRQYCTMYGEPGPRLLELRSEVRMTNNSDPIVVKEWSEFTPPPTAVTRDGIWLPDDLFLAHLDAIREVPLSARGWRAWTAGVPTRDIKDGEVIPGR